MRKRTTQTISNLKKISANLNSRKSSFLKSGSSLQPFFPPPYAPSFSTSTSAINEVIEAVVEKVNLAIKTIQEKKYYCNLMKEIDWQSMELQHSVQPYIGSPAKNICPEEEPERVALDHICQKDLNIEKKKTAKRSRSNLSLFNQSISSQKKEKSAAPSAKHLQTSKSSKFIPLENVESLKDFNTLHFQTVYREKYQRQSLRFSKEAIPAPSLLLSKKGKNEKEVQFNFDYNGEKIPISSGIVQKANQINVLKTTYRITKDKQEDIKNPKRVLERISFNRFPSILNKKLMSSYTQISQLKSSIQKSFDQKACKLTSIKTIKEDL